MRKITFMEKETKYISKSYKLFKCMECGKKYKSEYLPVIKDKFVDGCCSVGSLIEIK